jgi:phosphopantetheinyl transferase (holo-ACP synthase)
LAELAGTGLELTSVHRLRRAHERFGERLLARVFTPAEVSYARRKRDGTPNLAARFAAKAAVRGRTAARLSGTPLRIALSLTHEADFGLASVWVQREDG